MLDTSADAKRIEISEVRNKKQKTNYMVNIEKQALYDYDGKCNLICRRQPHLFQLKQS